MSGIREITKISKQYKKAIIVFHEDLDGITSAIAIKEYLKNNGIETIDCDQIQYGEKEFALRKRVLDDETMMVLVDFAHGKPEFTIHTDHHISQIGHTQTKSTSFLKAYSNEETLSGIISNPLFPEDDIEIISVVDSARFYEKKIKPKDVINFIYKFDKIKGFNKNKWSLGLVANKLTLAYKNKPNFMKEVVMSSSPSLLSIYQNIIRIGKKYDYWKTKRSCSFPPEGLMVNSTNYIKDMKKYPDKKISDCGNILIQYDAGNTFVAGGYDRYVGFMNHPKVNFQVLAWNMGLIQISCNPFKEKKFNDIDLSVIGQKVLENHKQELQSIEVNLRDLKAKSEGGYKTKDDSMGFRYVDLTTRFTKEQIKCDVDLSDIHTDPWKQNIIDVLDKPYKILKYGEKEMLENIKINAFDVVQNQSGGHKNIYNLSGIGLINGDTETILRNLQSEIVEELQNLIKNK